MCVRVLLVLDKRALSTSTSTSRCGTFVSVEVFVQHAEDINVVLVRWIPASLRHDSDNFGRFSKREDLHQKLFLEFSTQTRVPQQFSVAVAPLQQIALVSPRDVRAQKLFGVDCHRGPSLAAKNGVVVDVLRLLLQKPDGVFARAELKQVVLEPNVAEHAQRVVVLLQQNEAF